MTGMELKTWVESIKMEHRAFAKELGISVSTLYNWYHREKPLSRVIVRAIKEFKREMNWVEKA